MRKAIIRTVIGVAIGALFIWLSARDWPMGRLAGDVGIESGHLVVGEATVPTTAKGDELAGQSGWVFDLLWLVPYLLILTAIHFLRVIRWRPLLDPVIKLDFWTHNRIGAVGFMAMFLFPLRLGELVRPYLVKTTTGKVRMSRVLGSVFVERVVDGLMVSLILFGVLAFLPATDPSVADKLRIGAVGALGVFVGASLLLAGAVWQRQRTVRFVELTIGRISAKVANKINEILDAFLLGLKELPSLRSLLWFLLLTAIYWAINGLGVWCMARAFYLPVDIVGCYAMMACVVVGMMIPNSPGNVGSFWYFLLIPLALYGVSQDSTQAIAFGITVWFLQLVQQTVFGAWFIIRGQVSLRRVMEATQHDDSKVAGTKSEVAALPGS